MDEIKTPEDRFFADLESSSTTRRNSHKFIFENNMETFDDTLYNLISKKRKLSMENHARRGSLDLKNTSVCSLNNSVDGMTTWDIRRLKADLAEAQTRASNFKVEVDRLHKLRQEGEILYESKVRELTKQCDFTANKVEDLEKHVSTLKKREHYAKSELIKVKSELSKSEKTYKDEIRRLEFENHQLNDNQRRIEEEFSHKIRRRQTEFDNLRMEYDLTAQENLKLKEQLEEYVDKSEAFDSIRAELDKTEHDLEEAKKRIKSLEFEVGSFGDWKDVAKVSQKRLAELPEKDKEMARLQTFNKNLLDTVGNKLLLEEQVYDLKGRLERYENDKEELIKLKVHVSGLEEELKEWKRIAKDHCTENSLICPYSLRSRIEEILQKDILLTSEQGSIKFEKHSYESQLKDLQEEKKLLTKNNEDLNKVLQTRSSVLQKIQKKLLLLVKQRDVYKNFVDLVKKDLTILGNMTETSSFEQHLRSRVEMLEKMLENLEKELNNIKAMPEIPLQMTANGSDYEYLKKKIDDLKLENDRLKRRKEELELEIEQRFLRGDFNVAQFKVVHMANNPAAEAYENTKNEISKLHAEIERLRRKNKKLEEEHEEMTTKINVGETSSDLTKNFMEAGQLKQKVETLESKIKNMKEVYKSARSDFREVVYMLLGYKIDVDGPNYRISNVFAENETDYLNFRLTESGTLDMLESGYLTDALVNTLQQNLIQHKSLPVFLSQLTLELFNRTTVALN